MLILKNSKDMLEYIQSRSLSFCNSIKTFDFSTLYTTILHSKLKDRLGELVQRCFIKKIGQRRCKYRVLGRDRSYCVNKYTLDSTKTFSETDIINMLELLIDNIFVIFDGRVFEQSACIWVQPVLLFSPTCSFIKRLLKKPEKNLARSFNFMFRYILVDDVLSLNNSRSGSFVNRMYPIELYRIPQIKIGLIHSVTYTSKLTVSGS